MLIWRRHYAAIKSSVHSGSNPDVFVCVDFSIYSNFCIGGFIVKQHTFDGDSSIVNFLTRNLSQLIANFTAVTVNAIADAVDKAVSLFLNRNVG